jgi:hypothetical protein
MPSSVLEVVGHLTAILAGLLDDLLVQPDVHGGRVLLVARVVQLVGKLLADLQTAVEIEQLQQVDDGALVGEGLALVGGKVGEDLANVDEAPLEAPRSTTERFVSAFRGWTAALTRPAGRRTCGLRQRKSATGEPVTG